MSRPFLAMELFKLPSALVAAADPLKVFFRSKWSFDF
jgi:hypothetical protein